MHHEALNQRKRLLMENKSSFRLDLKRHVIVAIFVKLAVNCNSILLFTHRSDILYPHPDPQGQGKGG
jgi:hypothetical protein